MFSDWTRGEFLQLGGIFVASMATAVGAIGIWSVKKLHIEINSRFTEMLKLKGEVGEAKGRADAIEELNIKS